MMSKNHGGDTQRVTMLVVQFAKAGMHVAEKGIDKVFAHVDSVQRKFSLSRHIIIVWNR